MNSSWPTKAKSLWMRLYKTLTVEFLYRRLATPAHRLIRGTNKSRMTKRVPTQMPALFVFLCIAHSNSISPISARLSDANPNSAPVIPMLHRIRRSRTRTPSANHRNIYASIEEDLCEVASRLSEFSAYNIVVESFCCLQERLILCF